MTGFQIFFGIVTILVLLWMAYRTGYQERITDERWESWVENLDPERIEAAAQAIYYRFKGAEDHPWVDNGNSDKQEDARRYAKAALSATWPKK